MDQFLDRSVFMNILQYEEQMMYGQFNKEIVENLINLYAQCVEFYDSLRDPIKFYFLEKMQIILSHEKTLKEIVTPKNIQKINKITPQNKTDSDKNIIIDNFEDEDQGEQSNENNSRICLNFSEIIQMRKNTDEFNQSIGDNESDYYDLDNYQGEDQDYRQGQYSNYQNNNRLTIQQMRQKYKQSCKQQVKYSISKKRLERSKRVGMYLQIHQEQNINQADTMGSLYQSYVDNNQKQAHSVKQNLNQQQQEVERRLQRRKTLKEGGQNNIQIDQQKQSNEKNNINQQLKKDQQITAEEDIENQDPKQ